MIRSKVFPIEVPESAPFQHDSLKREPFLQRLSRLTGTAPTPLVIGIDSEWGSGKTKFLEMWRACLKASGRRSVYFNAWKADYAGEPLAPLLAALRDEFPEEEKTLLEKGRRLLGAILKSAGPGMLKAATAGMLDLRDPEMEAALTGAIEKVAEDQIESFSSKAEVVRELKCFLMKLAEDAPDSRIVIFIDELDRCRPTFAVEVMERVKHVFDAQGLVFVVALDKLQLGYAVRSIYGQGFDGAGYLGRFFDCTFRLPKPDLSSFAQAVLTERIGIAEVIGDRGSDSERAFLVEFFGCVPISVEIAQMA